MQGSQGGEGIAGLDEVRAWLAHGNRLGPRLTGSPAHHAFVEWLARGFGAAGLELTRIPYRFTRWEARQWSAHALADDGRAQPVPIAVPVASCYPFCAGTPAEGVTGQLLRLGDVCEAAVDERARGRILHVRCTAGTDWQPPLARLWGMHDPQGGPVPRPAVLATRHWRRLQELRLAGARAGALGLLLGWSNLSEAHAAGQYQPMEHLLHHLGRQGLGASTDGSTEHAQAPPWEDGLPALWLGPQGESALQAAGEAPRVRMHLQAALHPHTATDTLVAHLPGATQKTIVLLTHSDGVNACQENGGMALLALARHCARLPATARRYGLTCVATTGHFAGGLVHAQDGAASRGELRDVLQRFPRLRHDAVAVIGIEQLGAQAWSDHGAAYAADARPDLAHCATAHPVLARILLRAFEDKHHCALYVADTGMLGEAGQLAAEGVPAALYMGIPSYVMASAPDGHLGKLSPERLHEELQALAHAVAALQATPQDMLRASSAG